MYQRTLQLISQLGARAPAACLPGRLVQLFQVLAAECSGDAGETQDMIWTLWMYHPHRAAAQALERATGDIAARRYDIAETRLALLLRSRPDFPEAWNKRATLYYIQERDDECLADIHRTLELEPRHFGALAGFGEICLGRGDEQAALLAFRAALRLNPHLADVAESCRTLAVRLGGGH
jgi:tetratricopeptide (TPR) repeat protein